MSKIKYFVMDVDGTLTDGKIYMGANGEVMKAFDIKDGYGIHEMLPKLGITPVILTGRTSEIVENRCAELGIKYLFQGVSDKVACLKAFLKEVSGSLSEVAYIGDDLNDMPCMKVIKKSGGMVACPSNAIGLIRDFADFVAGTKGGEGAVRDCIDYLKTII
jgi:3-deoxy-D-manno-octulosonate 8-phosphate phosphatase (KDO 8-P phosphatase)